MNPCHYPIFGKRLAVAIVLSIATVGAVFASQAAESALSDAPLHAWALPRTKMPLGPSGLTELRKTVSVAPGITYHQVARGHDSDTDFWTVTVAPVVQADKAFAAAQAIRALGYRVRYDDAGRAPDGTPLGFNLSTGRYASKQAAHAAAQDIAARTHDVYVPKVRHSSIDGKPNTTGPWLVNIVAIAPTFRGKLQGVVAGADESGNGGRLGIDGELTLATARRLNAIVGINGGYWTTNRNAAGVTLRGPAGAMVSHGRLASMATTGETGIVFTQVDGHPKVTFAENLSSAVTVSNHLGASANITAINSAILGQHFNCGSTGAAPSSMRAHDYTCLNFDDMVLYDDHFMDGTMSSKTVDVAYNGPTYSVVVNRAGGVLSGSQTLGVAPPSGGYVLQGLGESALWLREHAPPGTTLSVDKRLFSKRQEIALQPGVSVVAAGPVLLPAENVIQQSATEGFNPAFVGIDRAKFYWNFVTARNPRSAMGVAPDGTILLMQTDGRQPGLALGTSLQETAALMQWMGATSAVNLDGGESSMMVIHGVNVSHPSKNAPTHPTEEPVVSSIIVTAE